jgi:glyoxylase-like metal-dependent hydrolase (beta-lactamase superfamily II)
MNLEDHAGDVVRKARLMLDVPAVDSANAGKISLEALTAFEQSGGAPTGMDWEGIARRLDLSGTKLRQLTEGWAPKPVEVSLWRHLRVITTEGNGMTVNAFLVWDDATRDAALFDTGFDAAPIFACIDSEKLQLKHLFITHTHGDHVAALEPIRGRYPQLHLHTNAKSAPAQHRNRPGETVALGGLRISNRETPGHAEDGVTYVVSGFPNQAPDVAVVGDAVFAGSIGGAPGKGGPTRKAIREQIFSLPGATLLCPGHGPLTTLEEQKRANPFFAEA